MKKIKCEMEDKREKRLSPDESKGNKQSALEKCLAWENSFSRDNKLLSAPA